jgi:hypothetical protein
MQAMKPHHTPLQVTPLASRTPCAMLHVRIGYCGAHLDTPAPTMS